MKKEMRIKSLKTLLVLCMTLALLLVGTACSGGSSDNSEVGEEEGLEDLPDVVEDEFYQSIDPYNDGPITLIDTENVSVRDVEPGTILGQFDAGDYQIQLSKPQLPDEVMSEVESYDYQWLMVKQTGGLVVDEYSDSYSLIIFFPNSLVITAYRDDQGYAGGPKTNFGYSPSPSESGGELIGSLGFVGNDVNPTGANDDLLGYTVDDFDDVIEVMECSY
ncbi:hypothetical protein IIY59_02480 [Candidatus Saccharibacteria bacterium]|nr:hypothetical protein [Candidatus Saccharibacteria bacterium]